MKWYERFNTCTSFLYYFYCTSLNLFFSYLMHLQTFALPEKRHWLERRKKSVLGCHENATPQRTEPSTAPLRGRGLCASRTLSPTSNRSYLDRPCSWWALRGLGDKSPGFPLGPVRCARSMAWGRLRIWDLAADLLGRAESYFGSSSFIQFLWRLYIIEIQLYWLIQRTANLVL